MSRPKSVNLLERLVGLPPASGSPFESQRSSSSPPCTPKSMSGYAAMNCLWSSSKISLSSQTLLLTELWFSSRQSTMKLCSLIHASITFTLCFKLNCKGRQRIPHRKSISPKAHSTAIRDVKSLFGTLLLHHHFRIWGILEIRETGFIILCYVIDEDLLLDKPSVCFGGLRFSSQRKLTLTMAGM